MNTPPHVSKLIEGHEAQMAYLASRTTSDLTRMLRCSREELRDAMKDFREQRDAQLQNLIRTENATCLIQAGWSPESVVGQIAYHDPIMRRHLEASRIQRRREDRSDQQALRQYELQDRAPRRIARKLTPTFSPRFFELNTEISNREPGSILREQQRRTYVNILTSDGGRHASAAASLNRVLASQGAAQIDFTAPMTR